jgi:hypothetical protein
LTPFFYPPCVSIAALRKTLFLLYREPLFNSSFTIHLERPYFLSHSHSLLLLCMKLFSRCCNIFLISKLTSFLRDFCKFCTLRCCCWCHIARLNIIETGNDNDMVSKTRISTHNYFQHNNSLIMVIWLYSLSRRLVFQQKKNFFFISFSR